MRPVWSFVPFLSAGILGISSTVAHAQAAEASAEDVEALRAKVERLESSLNQLQQRLEAAEGRAAAGATAGTAATAATPANGTATAATPPPSWAVDWSASASEIAVHPGEAPPPRRTSRDEMTGVARVDTAPPPNNPELTGFISIPGTQTMVRLNGFARINAIYDLMPAGNEQIFVPSSFPIDGGNGKNARISANSTRLSLEVRRPTRLGPLRIYVENDFYGGNNTPGFRLRQASAQVGNFYGGYGFSAFVDTDAYPDTLDDEGPVGLAFLRTASVRHIVKVSPGVTATISVENPSSEILNLPAAATDEQVIPDFVGALRFEGGWGHIQGAGVVRSIGYRWQGNDHNRIGWGVNLSSLFELGTDSIQAGVTYGDGIARFINDMGGLGYDAVIRPDLTLRTLTAYSGFIGYTHFWSPHWQSNITGSIAVLERDRFLPDTAYRRSTYGAANVIYQANSFITVGFETLYGRHKLQNGDDHDAVRLQTSVKYDFQK
ncbi:MAG: porin [Brevundimonas sp.]|nr:porin [Brevundimonas sp.]